MVNEPICLFSPCMRGFSPGTTASSHCPKNMHVRLIGDSKIVPRSECERVHGCLSRLSLCGPVMDWQHVQVVPRLSPNDHWDRLQPPCDPTVGLSGCRKWTDHHASLTGSQLPVVHVSLSQPLSPDIPEQSG